MPAEELKLTLNLDEIFGQKVPDDPVLRGDVAQEAIDIIIARTQAKTGLNGRPFKPIDPDSPYGKYKKGITGNTDADLTLFGDMLNGIETIEESRGEVVLGFPDELQNAKAYNHNTGDTLPKREFFGLTQKEKQRIADKYSADIEAPEIILTAKQAAKENRLLEALRYLNDLTSEQQQLTFDNLLKRALKKRGISGE